MNKAILTVLASTMLMATGAASGADKTYVIDSSGNPIMHGSSCLVAGGNGTQFDQCVGEKMMAEKATEDKMMAKPAMMEKAATDNTYVADGSGENPVMIGDNCVIAAANNGTAFEQCGSGAKAMMTEAAPKPKVITKVIVDCSKCN